ncbi:MAG: hypothetical protein GX541_05535 [Clostridiales bacterium]|jgi:hypothetical protein|nr:hypothetical protein [Clostridiales bacterium]
MNPLMILFAILGIAIIGVMAFIVYLLYVNSRNAGKESIAEKENELIDLYLSLEQMMKEIEIYTEKAKSEINSDIERIKNLHLGISEQSRDVPESNQSAKSLYGKGTDVDYAEKCRMVRHYHKNSRSVPEIARIMDMGQGEVRLILDLKN